jgi:hypothetical protein
VHPHRIRLKLDAIAPGQELTDAQSWVQTALVHHYTAPERDDDDAVLVEPGGLDGHDPHVRSRLRLAFINTSTASKASPSNTGLAAALVQPRLANTF